MPQNPLFDSDRNWKDIDLNSEKTVRFDGKDIRLPNGIICPALLFNNGRGGYKESELTEIFYRKNVGARELSKTDRVKEMTYIPEWNFWYKVTNDWLELWGLKKNTSVYGYPCWDSIMATDNKGELISIKQLDYSAVDYGWWTRKYPDELRTICEFIDSGNPSNSSEHTFTLDGIISDPAIHPSDKVNLFTRRKLSDVLVDYRERDKNHLNHRLKKNTIISRPVLEEAKKKWENAGSPSLHNGKIPSNLDQNREIFPKDTGLKVINF